MGSSPRSDGSAQATQQPTRDELAAQMASQQARQQQLTPQQLRAMEISLMPGAQGTYAGMGGGASYTGGMPMRR